VALGRGEVGQQPRSARHHLLALTTGCVGGADLHLAVGHEQEGALVHLMLL